MSDHLLVYEEDDRYDRGSSEESDDSVQEDGEMSSSDAMVVETWLLIIPLLPRAASCRAAVLSQT